MRASIRKYGNYLYNRDYALARFPYVQINSLDVINYIVFDLDYPGGEFIDMALGLPAYTFAMVNSQNGHAHVAYEIDSYPVRLASSKSKDLMKAVVTGYRRLLHADRVITTQHFLVKNPFSTNWVTYGSGAPTTLTEMAESMPVIEKPRSLWSNQVLTFEEALIPSSRNCTLFNYCRVPAYALVASSEDEENLYEKVVSMLEQANRMEIQKYFVSSLAASELICIARSITKWTWQRRNQFRSLRRGAMRLPSLKGSYRPPKVWRKEVKARQALAGQYAAAKRREKSRDLIKSSIGKFRSEDRIPSLSEVQKDTGLSYRTIQRHKDLFAG
jgi:hypothetical protein